MEVPNPLHHNNYVNSKLSNSEPDEPSYSTDCKCISSYDVNKKNYSTDSTLSRENKRTRKGQFSPLRSDSNPYITPKFQLRRKEELPSVTPHWSNSKGMELKETVPTVLNDEEYSTNSFGRAQSFIRNGGGSRISSYTNSQTGPYTPPQFFFSPQKYIETSRTKKDILVSIDNKVPPSLQSWANQKPLHAQDNRELQDLTKDVENEKSVQRLREHRVREGQKVKLANSEPRSKQYHNNERYNKSEVHRGLNAKNNFQEKSQTALKSKSKDFKHGHLSKTKHNFRGNEDGVNNPSIKRYKKLHDKSRSTTTNAIDTWRQALDNKLNDKLKSDDKKPKQVYGNDSWRQKHRNIYKQEKDALIADSKEIDKKNVYGNETWKKNISTRPKEPKNTVESELPATKSKRYSTANQLEQKVQSQKVQEKVSKDTRTNLMSNQQNNQKNDSNTEYEDKELLETDNRWEDIEPYLPSFLSTTKREMVKEHNKPIPPPQQVKPNEKENINKKKENKSKGSMSASTKSKAKEGPLTKVKRAYQCFFQPVVKNKNKEDSISLFKHFQTRSKMLRKQHSMLGKKKANLMKNQRRTLSAKNVINYYISQRDLEENENEAEKKKEDETSFRSGTVCDIDDDGFKVSPSNLDPDSISTWQTENRQRIDSLLGYDGLFGI